MQLNIGTLVIIAVIAIILYFYTQCEKKEQYSHINNMEISGSDLPSMPMMNKSLEECSEACKNNPDCLFWNYDSNTRKCLLKRGNADNNLITGFNVNREDAVIAGDNVYISGHNIPNMPISGVASKEECAQLCRSNDCAFWSYNKQGQDCFLKKGSPKQGMITGFNVPPYECPTCPEQVCPETTCPEQVCPMCPECPSCPECPESTCPACPESTCPECPASTCPACPEYQEKTCPTCPTAPVCKTKDAYVRQFKLSCINNCCKSKCKNDKKCMTECVKNMGKGKGKKYEDCGKFCTF